MPAKPSFEERLEKVNLMIERAELDDDKLDGDERALSQFSDEAVDLKGILRKIGPQKDVCNRTYLTCFFQSFSLKKKGIECLDIQIEQFKNLQILNLSFNKLETLEYLPPNLKELHCASNQLVSINTKPVKSLIHIGLAYNQLTENEIPKIAMCFPNLFSVDMSFNKVCCLQTIVDSFKHCAGLKMLNFKGNPVVLAKNYRPILKQKFQ